MVCHQTDAWKNSSDSNKNKIQILKGHSFSWYSRCQKSVKQKYQNLNISAAGRRIQNLHKFESSNYFEVGNKHMRKYWIWVKFNLGCSETFWQKQTNKNQTKPTKNPTENK